MSSKHTVKVSVPTEPCYILAWTQNGYLPKLFFLSPERNWASVPMATYEYHCESILQSKNVDSFGNKPVFHNFVEGELALIHRVLGIDLRPYDTGEFYYYSATMPGWPTYKPYALRLGRGPNRSNVPNQYWDIVTISADYCRYDIYETSTNKKLSTETSGWKSFTREGTQAYAVQWTRSEPTSYGKSSRKLVASYYENKVADGHSLTIIGYYNGIPKYDIKKALSLVPKALPLIDHILPESFTDDVFNNFAIPDVNNCENLSQLRDIKNSLPPLLKLIRRHNIKSLAELYLWWKYTYSTTILDIRAYYEFFQKWHKDSSNGKNYRRIDITYSDTILVDSSPVDRVTRYHVYTKPYNVGVLEALGLNINLSNTWDLLPFSFVVDWFVKVGDLLARIDHDNFMSHVQILTVSVTTKCTQRYSSLPNDLGTSSLIRSQFRRDVMTTLPIGCISLSTSNPFRHILDGSALYFANKR